MEEASVMSWESFQPAWVDSGSHWLTTIVPLFSSVWFASVSSTLFQCSPILLHFTSPHHLFYSGTVPHPLSTSSPLNSPSPCLLYPNRSHWPLLFSRRTPISLDVLCTIFHSLCWSTSSFSTSSSVSSLTPLQTSGVRRMPRMRIWETHVSFAVSMGSDVTVVYTRT